MFYETVCFRKLGSSQSVLLTRAGGASGARAELDALGAVRRVRHAIGPDCGAGLRFRTGGRAAAEGGGSGHRVSLWGRGGVQWRGFLAARGWAVRAQMSEEGEVYDHILYRGDVPEDGVVRIDVVACDGGDAAHVADGGRTVVPE